MESCLLRDNPVQATVGPCEIVKVDGLAKCLLSQMWSDYLPRLKFQQQEMKGSLMPREQIHQVKRVAEDAVDKAAKKRRAVFGDITNVSVFNFNRSIFTQNCRCNQDIVEM